MRAASETAIRSGEHILFAERRGGSLNPLRYPQRSVRFGVGVVVQLRCSFFFSEFVSGLALRGRMDSGRTVTNAPHRLLSAAELKSSAMGVVRETDPDPWWIIDYAGVKHPCG
jgi:hypothetical protein